ncbi:MAG: hypothetical protein IH969_07405, partial [Candidatus Krumholzibacteriota bacterium]|nr:hypothetical protein [Candidatus Krumholzibacteriota bacterium]
MFTYRKKTIEKIAVVGSGQIGPDIALYFAKVFVPHDVPVVVVDVSPEALASGRDRTYRKIDKGVESGAFKEDFGAAMKAGLESDWQERQRELQDELLGSQ